MASDAHEATRLLLAWNGGDTDSRDRLMTLVFDELRRLAGAQLRNERRDHTLQATALVNEAYLRMIDQNRAEWSNRAQFLGIAARMMRRILVDHARRRRADRRGGGVTHVLVDDRIAPGIEPRLDLVALDEALDTLQQFDERAAHLVELRYFAGLTIEETAEVLDVSTATAKRDWLTARAWLRGALTSTAERP